MKRQTLIVSIILSVAALCFTACGASKDVSKSVDASSATGMAARKTIVVLDVRTPGEFAEGHLPGAINIDYLNPSFKDMINNLDKKKEYLVYCRSGHRSTQAIEVMKGQQFKKLTNMLGGFLQWKGPVVK